MNNDIFLMKFKASDPIEKVAGGLKNLFLQAKLDQIIEPLDITALKVHFGEEGNSSYLAAKYIKPIVEKLQELKAKPFVSDSNVLYKSRRDNAIDHLSLANEHGFSYETLGAPVIISDGIVGRNEREIEINAPINKTISLASDYVDASSIIVISHVTGHIATGFGATIKNMGMGMSSRKGKLNQHSVSKPQITSSTCTACGLCQQWCPEDAIVLDKESAQIEEVKCIGCGECLAICRQSAVSFRWDNTTDDLQKQIAEHALGIATQKKDKIGYFTFLINMTKDCDCLKQRPLFIIEDIGVLAGKDPVAIDQAVLDLTAQEKNKNISELSYPSIDATIQLKYGEQIGLGKRKYILRTIAL